MARALWLTWLLALGACAHRPSETPRARPPSVPAPRPQHRPAPASTLELPPAGSVKAIKRLDFRLGEPTVPIRLMEGQSEVLFSGRGRIRAMVRGGVDKQVEAPAGTLWKVRVLKAEPAALSVHIQVAEFPFVDKAGVQSELEAWARRGIPVETHVLGSVYGIAGKVIDNRRYLLLIQGELPPDGAHERQAQLLRQFGVRTSLFEEVRTPASGTLELLDASGTSLALGQDHIFVETLDHSGFNIHRVEYGVGYAFHNFEDRSYRGSLQLTLARDGTLAVINVVSVEELLKGLVPSEIFSRAHPEALKAQAVTARGELLAKVGTKHLADPYLLCSEQHCAVYKGLSGETAATNAAVEATRGEGIFDAEGKLVDSVYSAVCGGHTESNENVWGGPPNPSLRGQPDLLEPAEGTPGPEHLAAFLQAKLPAACRLSSFAQPSKFRWERRFTAEELNALTASLGLGPIHAISVVERGVSGRAKLVALAGEAGATEVRGELNIRRLFGMLNSSMFLVQPELDARRQPTGWVFRGGGWGHGVGMCQTGAIGRAEAGQDYRTILRHYFNGAEVSRIY